MMKSYDNIDIIRF